MEKAMVERTETSAFKAEYLRAGITLEAFIKAVGEKTGGEKSNFIPAVYQVLASFVEKEKEITGIKLACKKGCSHCCEKVLLACTELEIEAVISFINGLPRPVRILLLKKIRQYMRDWKEYYLKNELIFRTNPLRVRRDWQKPCVFLADDGSCAIYPVRIIDCQTHTSLVVCSPEMEYRLPCPIDYLGPCAFRFESETWANNLILGQQGEIMGISDPRFVPVTVIYHWFIVKKRELF